MRLSMRIGACYRSAFPRDRDTQPMQTPRKRAGFVQRTTVFNLIKAKSFAKGKYVLASGRQSDYYLDMKPTMFDPEGANALTEIVLDKLEELEVDYVGGLALGAVPLISTITMLSHLRKRPLPGFFVRKEVKDHGTKKLVEGLATNASRDGKRGVHVDVIDTCTG